MSSILIALEPSEDRVEDVLEDGKEILESQHSALEDLARALALESSPMSDAHDSALNTISNAKKAIRFEDVKEFIFYAREEIQLTVDVLHRMSVAFTDESKEDAIIQGGQFRISQASVTPSHIANPSEESIRRELFLSLGMHHTTFQKATRILQRREEDLSRIILRDQKFYGEVAFELLRRNWILRNKLNSYGQEVLSISYGVHHALDHSMNGMIGQNEAILDLDVFLEQSDTSLSENLFGPSDNFAVLSLSLQHPSVKVESSMSSCLYPIVGDSSGVFRVLVERQLSAFHGRIFHQLKGDYNQQSIVTHSDMTTLQIPIASDLVLQASLQPPQSSWITWSASSPAPIPSLPFRGGDHYTILCNIYTQSVFLRELTSPPLKAKSPQSAVRPEIVNQISFWWRIEKVSEILDRFVSMCCSTIPFRIHRIQELTMNASACKIKWTCLIWEDNECEITVSTEIPQVILSWRGQSHSSHVSLKLSELTDFLLSKILQATLRGLYQELMTYYSDSEEIPSISLTPSTVHSRSWHISGSYNSSTHEIYISCSNRLKPHHKCSLVLKANSGGATRAPIIYQFWDLLYGG